MIENVSTQLTVFHCFAHCLLPGRAFASLYVLLFLEKEAEIGGRDKENTQVMSRACSCNRPEYGRFFPRVQWSVNKIYHMTSHLVVK